MKTQQISLRSDGVFANRRAGRLRYALGKVAPHKFGMPMHVQAVLTGPDGKVKEVRNIYNSVTNAGKYGIADNILASPTLGKPTHMAVGTGTGGTTSLTTELDRNAFTSKTRNNAVVTMVGDWAAADATGALTEAGVFNQSSAGDMWLYTSFSVINKGAADALTITWTLTIS